ncbi:hypothetical protein SLS62_005701 [Diatrype stigma]|uniref:Uncharacterized protein n=1 Tax=Diatrype stigma TaxID=117547 RepID=A0AAN9UNS9_9PEZI
MSTMWLEAVRCSGPKSTCVVQCVFAHNCITPTFLEEQKAKPDLCKRIEALPLRGQGRAGDRGRGGKQRHRRHGQEAGAPASLGE